MTGRLEESSRDSVKARTPAGAGAVLVAVVNMAVVGVAGATVESTLAVVVVSGGCKALWPVFIKKA